MSVPKKNNKSTAKSHLTPAEIKDQVLFGSFGSEMKKALKSVKRISYFQSDEGEIEETKIYIQESLDPAYGFYIWPSSLVMSEFIWHYQEYFGDCTVLEVGAGTSLPSLLLSKLENRPRIILTDIPAIIPVIHENLTLNEISVSDDQVWVAPLLWGCLGDTTSIDHVTNTVEREWKTRIDYVIGSDTFYEPSEFENLIVMISYIIQEHNPECKFFTAYQERSSNRSIQYLLDKWKLKCRLILKDSFYFDESKYLNLSDIDEEEDNASEVKVNAGVLASVFLLEISRK
ncbi:putative methyltransferase-domain-containing protein [Pilobolus umbonatus]|nr:putative methyltransferase-domain-containing protein [Pilobolus umbonatus]